MLDITSVTGLSSKLSLGLVDSGVIKARPSHSQDELIVSLENLSNCFLIRISKELTYIKVKKSESISSVFSYAMKNSLSFPKSVQPPNTVEQSLPHILLKNAEYPSQLPTTRVPYDLSAQNLATPHLYIVLNSKFRSTIFGRQP